MQAWNKECTLYSKYTACAYTSNHCKVTKNNTFNYLLFTTIRSNFTKRSVQGLNAKPIPHTMDYTIWLSALWLDKLYLSIRSFDIRYLNNEIIALRLYSKLTYMYMVEIVACSEALIVFLLLIVTISSFSRRFELGLHYIGNNYINRITFT